MFRRNIVNKVFNSFTKKSGISLEGFQVASATLTMDFDPSLGLNTSGSNVTDWTDQVSGVSVIQNTPSSRPTYVASDSVFNDKPSVTFDTSGGAQFLQTSAHVAQADLDPTSGITGYIVIRQDADTAQNTWMCQHDGLTTVQWRLWLDASAGQVADFQVRNDADSAWYTATTAQKPEDSGPIIVRFRLAAGGGTNGIRVGRNAETTASPADTNIDEQTNLTIGARGDGIHGLKGKIARILWYVGDVSAADDNFIMSELEQLYLPTLADLIPDIGFVIDPWADLMRDGYSAPHIRDASGVYAMTKTTGSGVYDYDSVMGGIAWKNTNADYIHAHPYSLTNADHNNQDTELISLSQGTTTGVDHIINAREGTDQGWQLYYGATDNAVFQAKDVGTATFFTIFVVGASSAASAHSHRVTFVNSTGDWELFEDGTSEASSTQANHVGGDFSGQNIQYGHRAGGVNTQALGPIVYCVKSGGFTAAERTIISNYFSARWSGYGGSL